MAKASQKKSQAEKAIQPRGLEVVSLLGGICIFMLGLGLLGNEGRALTWRLRAKWFAREGVARVEKTSILQDETDFRVEITYHVEADGRSFPSISRVEPDERDTSDRATAEDWRGKYGEGQLYPCWYSPADPTAWCQLTPSGLEIGKSLKRLLIPFLVLAAGWALCQWPWQRWKARGFLALAEKLPEPSQE